MRIMKDFGNFSSKEAHIPVARLQGISNTYVYCTESSEHE